MRRPVTSAALRLIGRRWWLFLLTGICIAALENLFSRYVHVPLAALYAQLIGEPLAIVVVIVFIGCDASESLPGARERWSRILERAWAIVAIDVILSFVNLIGIGALAASNLIEAFEGLGILFLSAMLIYAEPYAALEDPVSQLSLVPYALLRSMMLAWTNGTRVLWAFMLILASAACALYIHDGAQHWMKNPIPVDICVQTVLGMLLAALFTVAYLDALLGERLQNGR